MWSKRQNLETPAFQLSLTCFNLPSSSSFSSSSLPLDAHTPGRRALPRAESEQTRNEDGDESGAAVPLCKLFPRSASLLCGRAAGDEPPSVERRLRADTAHSLRLVLR